MNPSDSYTFYAETPEIARFVALLLGSGMYSAIDATTDEDIGGMVFGLSEDRTDEKIKSQLGGLDLTAFLDANIAMAHAALMSVLIGSVKDRQMVEQTIPLLTDEKREEWLSKYKDRQRSSMNNIQQRAEEWAVILKEKMVEVLHPPGVGIPNSQRKL